MKRVHIHIAGRSDLGVDDDQNIGASIDEMKRDPLWTVGKREQSHGFHRTPLGTVLVESTHPVPDRIIVVATSQSPPHPGDTLHIAEALRDSAIPFLSAFGDLPTVPKIDVLAIRRFAGLEVMARIKESLVDEPMDAEVTVEVGSGPATLFNGAILGVFASGRTPSVRVLTDGGDSVHRLSDIVSRHTDISRWLMRNRMWSALAEQVRMSQPQHAQILQALADNEGLRKGTGMSAPAVNYAYSSILGDLARGDRSWIPKMVRLIEVGSAKAFGRPGDERIRELVEYASQQFRTTPSLARLEPKRMRPHELAFQLGRVGGTVFNNCAALGNEFKSYWNGREGLRGARQLRQGLVRYAHGLKDEDRYQQSLTENLRRLSDLSSLLGGQRALDTESKNVLELGYGVPWDHLHPVKLVARLVGTSESEAIKSAVSAQFSSERATRQLEVGIGLTESINDLASCVDEISRQFDEDAVGAFNADQRIDAIVVVLGQGTKVMNAALMMASIVFAFHNRVSISFTEAVGRADTGTEVSSMALAGVEKMIGRLVDPLVIQNALISAVDRLDFGSMKALATLMDVEQESQVRADIKKIEDVLDGVIGDLDPTKKTASVLASISLIVDTIGSTSDADAVLKVSLLLSTATSDKPGDDAWKDEPELRPIWVMRNDSIHLRFDSRNAKSHRPKVPTWPSQANEESILVALCRALSTDVDEVRRHRDALLKDAHECLGRLRRDVRAPRSKN